MLNVQDINNTFLQSLGNIPVLEREVETWLFQQLSYFVVLNFALLRGLGMFEVEDEVARDYDASILEAEKKHQQVYLKVIEVNRTDLPVRVAMAFEILHMIYQILIRHNVRLVIAVIKKVYFYQGMTMLDLVDEGILSLVKTICRFDYTRGNKFSTYSIHWIQQAIYKALNQGSRVVNLPMHIITSIKKSSDILERIVENDDELTNTECRALRRTFLLPKKKISFENIYDDKDTDSPSLQENLASRTVEQVEVDLMEGLQGRYIDERLGMFAWADERMVRISYGLCWCSDEESTLYKDFLGDDYVAVMASRMRFIFGDVEKI